MPYRRAQSGCSSSSPTPLKLNTASNAGEKWAGIEWLETGFAHVVACIPEIAVAGLHLFSSVLEGGKSLHYHT